MRLVADHIRYRISNLENACSAPPDGAELCSSGHTMPPDCGGATTVHYKNLRAAAATLQLCQFAEL